jgi:hypothetical protein
LELFWENRLEVLFDSRKSLYARTVEDRKLVHGLMAELGEELPHFVGEGRLAVRYLLQERYHALTHERRLHLPGRLDGKAVFYDDLFSGEELGQLLRSQLERPGEVGLDRVLGVTVDQLSAEDDLVRGSRHSRAQGFPGCSTSPERDHTLLNI